MQEKTALERLDDWEALCDWLEGRRYNASYEPRCRGAYLLATPYSPCRTIQVEDTDAPPLVLYDGRTIPRKKEIPNPKLAEEKALAKWTREITKERNRLALVYWASGFGWRLRKDYKEKIAAERERLSVPA
jgi:hypothetical protein